MDQELLVENRIEEGRKVIQQLVRAGLDVTVAFWIKTSEEGLWFLYIGSNSVEPGKIGDAYVTAYDCLSRLPNASLSLSDIKFIPATYPLAVDAMALRDRHSGWGVVPCARKRLGNVTFEEVYVYPSLSEPMSPRAVEKVDILGGSATNGAPLHNRLAR